MDEQTSKAPVPQSDDINSDDYERGFKVLARIIARRHMRRMTANSENKDGISKDK